MKLVVDNTFGAVAARLAHTCREMSTADLRVYARIDYTDDDGWAVTFCTEPADVVPAFLRRGSRVPLPPHVQQFLEVNGGSKK